MLISFSEFGYLIHKKVVFLQPIFYERKTSNTDMENQVEEKNTNMGSVISRSEQFIEKNQKTLIIVVAAIVVVVLAFFGLRKWYFQPREVRAAEEMFAAEQWFGQGDFEKALNGDDNFRGFLSVADNYSCTKAGKLAKYYTGICYLNTGNYDEAIKWLKKYNGKDTFTGALSEMMIGDAYMEQGNTEKAISHYTAAAKKNANYVTSPTALFKAGMAYLKIEDNAKALECFKQIKKEYPESTEWSEIDRYIQIAETAK